MLNANCPPWPSYSDEEIDAAARVLASNRVNYWTGQECRLFEEEFAAWAGARHAVAIANGTVALDLALRGLEIGPGHEVIVTPRSFLASTSTVVTAGARPVFADVASDNGNLTAETIAAAITPRTKAIIVVHLAGWPCDMDPIMDLAARHDLKVIEDCAQAHGARYKGRSVGSIGHVGAWSFCQDKIMTTGGEGGMVTTDDTGLWDRMWSYKDHGKSMAAIAAGDHPPGYRWVHHSFGTNWRMIEIQAAIGRLQLRRMPQWSAARASNAASLRAALGKFAGPEGPIRCPWPSESDVIHAGYRLYAYVKPENLASGWSRDRIVSALVQQGVPCYQGSCPEIYREKAFDETPFRPQERLAEARALGETSLMFLLHPTLRPTDIRSWSVAIDTVLTEAHAQGV
jgi:dTDP-4-amino-4,6-dideoxygalactose transaminase